MIIPAGIHIIMQTVDGYAAEAWPLKFIVSEGVEKDGKKWLHASVSRVDGLLPSYDDLKQLKKHCIGDHRTALQVFPPLAKHVSPGSKYGVEVLHLWSCLDGDVTPDFTRGGSQI
jgi:hypothetical protein